MLFFVDESVQTVGGVRVGSLGAVAIPAAQYNRFCGWVYRLKQEELGAKELVECELKGSSMFARSAFRKSESPQGSALLRAVDRVVDGLREHDATVFALWTSQPELINLRSNPSTRLTEPYADLLHRLKRFMARKAEDLSHGALFLDQVGHREDMWAACAIQNYMTRTHHKYTLQKLFLQVPHFTHSAVSPGLQAADLVAYLAAQQIDPSHRPELKPWWERFEALARDVPDGHGSHRPHAGRMGTEI